MNCKIYPFKQHKVSLDQIDPDALYVLKTLTKAGYTAYLVGGGVRDLLLKRKPKDYDISTSAKPEEIKQLFRNCILIGRRFRLAHVRFGSKIIEVSTFRSGNNEADTLIVRDNEWGTPEEDVLRRDFTINGLFYDAEKQAIIDYVDGYQDIEKKYLKTIGQPHLRFKQDPVRMLRLIKFMARFGLEVDAETKFALVECRHEILKSSQARILEELLKMLESGSSKNFIYLLNEYGFLQLILPALSEFLETEEGEDVYNFLHEIDTFYSEFPNAVVERPLLVCCLLFPMLEYRIKVAYLDREKLPHLGEILLESRDTTNAVFNPFFLIPRRMKISIQSILTTQYRLTPLEEKKNRRLRIPNDPDFELALKFLRVRNLLEPGLQKIWEEWNYYFSKRSPSTKASSKPKRSYRGNRKKTFRRREHGNNHSDNS